MYFQNLNYKIIMENENVKKASEELTNFINELQKKHNVVVITIPKLDQNGGSLSFSISSYISIVENKSTETAEKVKAE